MNHQRKLADELKLALAELYLSPMWETRNQLAVLRIQLLIEKVALLEAGWQPIETAPTDGTEVLTCVGVHDWDIDIARFKPWHPLLAFRTCWRSSLTGAKIQPKYWLRLPPRPTYDEEKS